MGAFLALAPLLYGGSAQQGKAAPPVTPAETAKPATNAQDALEPLLAKTQEALDRNDYPAAIALLQTIVTARPMDALPHFELGYAYSQLQRNAEAVVEFRRALALNDQLAAAHLNLGLLLRDTDPASAAASFRRAAELMPGEGRPHYLAGNALEQSGKLPEAVAEYQAGVILAPKEGAMRLGLGRALLRADRAPEAESQFREAIALDGGPPASLALAEALLQQGKHAEAAGQFAAYLKDTPGDRAARFERAVALQNADRFDEALMELDRVEQNGPPTAASLKLRASVYLQQKKWTEATAAIAKAMPASPNDAQLYAWLGRARLNLRDFSAAETALERSLALDASPTAPLRDLVDVRYFPKQCAPTLATLDLLAKRLAPTPLDWFFRATCYDKLGQTQEAAASYQKFLDLDAAALPDQELSARLRLKLLLRELEQKAKARKR